MLPQSHIIIATHIHRNVKEKFNIELDKTSLIYGSIKPDIPFHSSGLPHFKPDSFNVICNQIHQLAQSNLIYNKEFIEIFSKQIGIITHYIADYFCVPHNDRKKYKDHFISHLQYENNLHKLYKSSNVIPVIKNTDFNMENQNINTIKSIINTLHKIYNVKNSSLMNDFESSIEATNIITSYIIFHATIHEFVYNAA